MTLRSCGSVSELRRRSRVRASRKRKRSADFPVLLCATVGCDHRFAYRFEAKPLHTRRRQAQCAQAKSSTYSFVLYFTFLLRLDSFRVPFDYAECESELVASMVTELSSLFYVCFPNEMLTHHPKLWANLHRRFELSSIDCFRVHAIHA